MKTAATDELFHQLPKLAEKIKGDLLAGVTAREIISSITAIDPLREAVETICQSNQPDPVQLGLRLRFMRGRTIGGKTMVVNLNSNGVPEWRIVPADKLAMST